MFLIVGLGNSDEKYNLSRHNFGFLAIEKLKEFLNLKWTKNSSLSSFLCNTTINQKKIILSKPICFINESGKVIKKLIDYFNISPENLIVLVDDFSIPLGNIKIKKSGTSGGHKGLESIIEYLKTEDFPRIRFGIGPLPLNIKPERFVLEKFTKEELEKLKIILENFCEVFNNLIDKSLNYAISRYNKKLI